MFTRSEAVSILADTGTTLPNQISDNLTAINSNATAIAALGSDAALISDVLTAVNSNALGISANLTAVNSNATALGIVKSDTVVIRSDTLATLALLDDARSEPGQGAPPVNPDAMTKIDYLYKNWRNRKTQTEDTWTLFADDATTTDQKATVSDDDTTGEKGEVATGA